MAPLMLVSPNQAGDFMIGRYVDLTSSVLFFGKVWRTFSVFLEGFLNFVKKTYTT